ncbi:MAG: hypothetical protein ACYDEO_28815, partial [Aggregatilineales bacterium]
MSLVHVFIRDVSGERDEQETLCAITIKVKGQNSTGGKGMTNGNPEIVQGTGHDHHLIGKT